MKVTNDCLASRNYSGVGIIQISRQMDLQLPCEFQLYEEGMDNLLIECSVDISTDFQRVFNLHKTGTILEAAFQGQVSGGLQQVIINNMFLKIASIKVNAPIGGSRATTSGREAGISNFSNKGLLVFVLFSELEIKQYEYSEDDLVVMTWSLSNFEISDSKWKTKAVQDKEIFNVNANGLKYSFSSLNHDDRKTSNTYNNNNQFVNAQVNLHARFSLFQHAHNDLMPICWLLSLVTLNWVMPVCCDITKNGKKMKSVLYNKKMPYSFIDGMQIVETQDVNFDLSEFVQLLYDEYMTIKTDFNIFPVIEYLLSALRQTTPESKFIMAMISLECLCSYVPEYAKKNGRDLISNDIISKAEIITKFIRKHNLNLSVSIINGLANEVAYKSIGIKTNTKYILDHFNISFDVKELDHLIEIRGQLVHTGIYMNIPELTDKTDILFNLIIMILLRLLGWSKEIRKLRY